MSIMASSSLVIGHQSTRLHPRPYQRPKDMPQSPVSNLGTSNFKMGNKSRVQFGSKLKRNSLIVCANSVPPPPLPSSTPPSESIKRWILGILLTLIRPFSQKWGPLWVLEKRIVNAVQTVEDVVEMVEKVAVEVDKIAEDISDDLPQGKLKDMVDFVEDMAEKTAKTADSLDNLIDRVQEVEEKVVDMVESIHEEIKSSPKEAAKES